MVFIPNVELATARAQFDPVTKRTGKPMPWLFGLLAHIGPVSAQDYSNIPPDLALKSIYALVVESEIDIAEGDLLTSIIHLDTGNPWPANLPRPGSPGAANISWPVRYLMPLSPGMLEQLKVVVELVKIGGQANRG